jgi:hypothetical protein
MRFRYLLPALALTAGSVFAQQNVQIPNAIGVWNSNGFPIWAWYYGNFYPAGTTGYNAYQTLPPELTTYFTSVPSGSQRVLRFRGFEMQTTYGLFSSHPAYDSPGIEIHDSTVHPTQPLRWIPGPNTFATFAAVPNLIPGNLGFPTIVVGADLGPGGAVAVPAGNAGGGALVMVWKDYQVQFGDGNSLWILGTGNEPVTGPASATTGYSGIANPLGQFLIIPNPAGTSSEYVWTWLFENSVISPVRNARFVSAGGLILGGIINPAPFAFQMDDGRGGINPAFGSAISYNGNSKEGNPQPAAIGTTWFAPFVLLSGYLGFGADPATEGWNSGSFATDNTPVWKWADDFCALSGACPSPGTGAVLNPANSTYGMWMGINLPFFLNLTVLLNNLLFADISSGFSWAGPSTLAYRSDVNPAGLLGRNLIALAGGGYFTQTGGGLSATVEHRSILNPQAGYSPIVPVAGGPPGTLGFGVHPGVSLVGSYVGIQCWMLDVTTNQVKDVTNVAVVRL